MTASKTIILFAWYLSIVGATLLIIPNIFLKTLSLPETNEPWIRVVGLLTLILGTYYLEMGKSGITAFAKITVRPRIVVFLVFIFFVIRGWFPPVMIGIGAIDLMGAVWTRYALKKEKRM